MLLTKAVLAQVESVLDEKILQTYPVSGGDINEAHRLSTVSGNYFIKLNNVPFAKDMFEKEAFGLKLIHDSNTIATPGIIATQQVENISFLLLNWIDPATPQKTFWESFGSQLAELHKQSDDSFGLIHDNYIGSLIQHNKQSNRNSNKQTTNAIPFFINQRLTPQIELAKYSNKIDTTLLNDFDSLFKKLPNILPDEKPALTHGDLWNGNFMINASGNVVLIDPAVSYSLREMDLAMTKLFGGFDELFYESYDHAFPVQPNLEKRIPIYQLYYLMVHVNLFGGSYVNSVRSILKQFY